ncbi:hypothetical protein B0H13DRAFT_1984497 [Mycena leptocephala]|nr:hypothetical protein B0H13DRAFT_1984497 [Mycena leptocephala]
MHAINSRQVRSSACRTFFAALSLNLGRIVVALARNGNDHCPIRRVSWLWFRLVTIILRSHISSVQCGHNIHRENRPCEHQF